MHPPEILPGAARLIPCCGRKDFRKTAPLALIWRLILCESIGGRFIRTQNEGLSLLW